MPAGGDGVYTIVRDDSKNEFAPFNGFELGVDGNGETRRGRSISMHAHSSRPTMKPVASTEGISRNVSD